MTEPFGLYIHVPFCATRCGYCDFNTYTPGELGSPRDLTGPYLDALDRELELAAARVGRPAETVFIGGGTPSLLGGQGLTRILNTVRPPLRLAPGDCSSMSWLLAPPVPITRCESNCLFAIVSIGDS